MPWPYKTPEEHTESMLTEGHDDGRAGEDCGSLHPGRRGKAVQLTGSVDAGWALNNRVAPNQASSGFVPIDRPMLL